MRVVLRRDSGGDPHAVLVTGPGISGHGFWRGDTPLVAANEVDVELEVPGQIAWKKILVARDMSPDILLADSELLLQGVVENLDQHGVLTLRIADGVVLIGTIGEPPLGVIGQRVAMLTSQTEIYPTGV